MIILKFSKHTFYVFRIGTILFKGGGSVRLYPIHYNHVVNYDHFKIIIYRSILFLMLIIRYLPKECQNTNIVICIHVYYAYFAMFANACILCSKCPPYLCILFGTSGQTESSTLLTSKIHNNVGTINSPNFWITLQFRSDRNSYQKS